jgi:Flp pilus assembly protein TadD
MLKVAAPITFVLMLAGCASAPSNLPLGVDMGRSGDPLEVAPRLTAADATREDGRFTEALQIYQQILVEAPSNTQAQRGVAECLLGVGKYAEARLLFQGLEHNADLRAAALQGEGLAALRLGKNEAAEQALRAATQADPSLWRSWNALGTLADRKNQGEDAVRLFAKAAEINPNSAAVKNNIGYSELMKGDAQHAAETLRAALALDPKSETIQNNLRLAIAATGNYDEALRSAPREQLPAVLNNVGYVAMRHGDLAAAEGYFARAMEASGSYATVTAKNLDQLKSEQAAAP